MAIYEVKVSFISDATIFVEADNEDAASAYLDSTNLWKDDPEIVDFANPREFTKKVCREVRKISDVDENVLATYQCPYGGEEQRTLAESLRDIESYDLVAKSAA